MNCNHNDVVFIGEFSMIGRYRCNDCDTEIDPVEYAKMKGQLNIKLLDYYTKYPDRLNSEWHNHPWVKHLYEQI